MKKMWRNKIYHHSPQSSIINFTWFWVVYKGAKTRTNNKIGIVLTSTTTSWYFIGNINTYYWFPTNIYNDNGWWIWIFKCFRYFKTTYCHWWQWVFEILKNSILGTLINFLQTTYYHKWKWDFFNNYLFSKDLSFSQSTYIMLLTTRGGGG